MEFRLKLRLLAEVRLHSCFDLFQWDPSDFDTGMFVFLQHFFLVSSGKILLPCSYYYSIRSHWFRIDLIHLMFLKLKNTRWRIKNGAILYPGSLSFASLGDENTGSSIDEPRIEIKRRLFKFHDEITSDLTSSSQVAYLKRNIYVLKARVHIKFCKKNRLFDLTGMLILRTEVLSWEFLSLSWNLLDLLL